MQHPSANAAADLAHVRSLTAKEFEAQLSSYRETVVRSLAAGVPRHGPPYLYDLARDYPARGGKGLRAALCLAACGAFGAPERKAVTIAAAAELFHNAFLIHDDIQDESLQRRGADTLHRKHGTAIALNVGNATNLMGLSRIIESRSLYGPTVSFAIIEETENMMRHSLEGQAIELAWIRDNAIDLRPADYLRMCLKKTSWYSFIYPLRAGATIARGAPLEAHRFTRFGWYFGATFQIQDDLLNLEGDFQKYGKELAGDIAEGKRTLMLIHLLNNCTAREKAKLKRFLAKSRRERETAEIADVYEQMKSYGSIDHARRSARQLAGAALLEAGTAFAGLPSSPQLSFILRMISYVIERDR